MVHCFAIAHLLGRPGAAAVVDHGMDYIWRAHRDARHGGYFWSLDDTRVIDDSKQAYGHAFVLLAASSAKCIGHPMADKVIADVTEVLEQLWEADRRHLEEYGRIGRSSRTIAGELNMHLTEALMAAFEATGSARICARREHRGVHHRETRRRS